MPRSLTDDDFAIKSCPKCNTEGGMIQDHIYKFDVLVRVRNECRKCGHEWGVIKMNPSPHTSPRNEKDNFYVG